MLALKLLALRALAAAADTGASSSDPCFADASNTFHVSIDPYASELGSWKFLECGDTPMPILAVEKGVTSSEAARSRIIVWCIFAHFRMDTFPAKPEFE